MAAKQFFDWQSVRGTDDVMRFVGCLESAKIWESLPLEFRGKSIGLQEELVRHHPPIAKAKLK